MTDLILDVRNLQIEFAREGKTAPIIAVDRIVFNCNGEKSWALWANQVRGNPSRP